MQLRYSEISSTAGINTGTKSSVLRRKIQLGKRNIEKHVLERQLVCLSNTKACTAAIAEKIALMEQSKLAQRAQCQAQRHRQIWQEENFRLLKWRLYLESELQDCVSVFFQGTCDNSSLYVKAIDEMENVDAFHEHQIEAKRKQITEDIQEIKEAVSDVIQKKPMNKYNTKEALKMKHKAMELSNALQKQLDDDHAQATALEKCIVDLCSGVLSVDDNQAYDPWVSFDGKIQRFTMVMSVDDVLTKRCNADYQKLIYWYQARTHQLYTKYADAVHIKHGGWSEDQHQLFEKLRDEYPPELRGRRALLNERLQLEFPEMSSIQIEDHEAWTMQHIAYKRHKKSLYNAFQIRIKEAIALTLDLFMEAKTMYEDQERQLQDRHTYLQKLELSQDHVRKWRDERIRQLRISTERAQAVLETQLEQERVKNEQEIHRRNINRAKLELFFVKRQHDKSREIELSRETQKNLKAEQLALRPINEERIMYREQQRIQKLEDKKIISMQTKEKKEALEEQLDKLRKSVAIDAKSDWNRLMGDTVAFAESRKSVDEPKWYKNNGFTVNEVLSDKRALVSIELYKHGLQGSQYASQVLHSMQPTHIRPEQATTIKFG
ncbi:hypothetical protein BASA50_001906 [Batrachochytrium salamandrivorans]|uniref:Uncharacterized protein n=1 Tax=Batrachochytrium salamandrivorans TaxID=1357716 RepID=A0ABQ8FQL8_9FUNG|nr:hypothetical protein BASA50_001906 [Batrachochytrium salamandrivorans]